MLTPLGLSPSFGFGDRLGLATPGHIDAVTGTKFAPLFAQQSVCENARTGRTPRQVLDDARWDAPWGADADHLKTPGDLPSLLDDFHAREVLHGAFGSVLAEFGGALETALVRHAAAYREDLRVHFKKHLDLLKDGRS